VCLVLGEVEIEIEVEVGVTKVVWRVVERARR
jgi:hypothetical protein